MKFKHTYSHLPERFYSKSTPAIFMAPKLIGFNQDLARSFNFDPSAYSEDELAKIFSGQKKLEGSNFISLAYAGHQFGGFSPSLGDGRAMLMGEVKANNNILYDVQLKGAGPTPFSRRGDGKSALGPVIREYILSEAMFHLNVPTTRALAAVLSGEQVTREDTTPGGVFTRVAKSHLRIGTFEYFAYRDDVEGLKILLDYSIDRLYPEVDKTNKAISFFKAVVDAQVNLVSTWMSLGFIHGVMNTDNMSISGETIDYGPCAFMDHFNPHQVYSFIDKQGRYGYSNQSKILVWNLSRLAACLIPLVGEDEEKSLELLNEELDKVESQFELSFHQKISDKFGIPAASKELVSKWFLYLQKENIDFTLGFRNLNYLIYGASNTPDLFYKETSEFQEFLKEWYPLLENSEKMNQVNPIYIPRNHQVEKAIQAALIGDYSIFKEMNQLLLNPFLEQAGFERYALPPQEDEKIKNTFCGT